MKGFLPDRLSRTVRIDIPQWRIAFPVNDEKDVPMRSHHRETVGKETNEHAKHTDGELNGRWVAAEVP